MTHLINIQFVLCVYGAKCLGEVRGEQYSGRVLGVVRWGSVSDIGKLASPCT